MKLDEKRPYGTIHGHAVYVYEQDGKFFNGVREQIDEEGNVIDAPIDPNIDPDKTIQTSGVDSATAFLKNLLKGGAMSKAILYSQAEGMQLNWEDVKKAAVTLKIIPSQRNKQEFWQLPES